MQVKSNHYGMCPNSIPEAADIDCLHVYDMCYEMNSYKVSSSRLPLRTCNNIDAWNKYRTGDQDDTWIIECITNGFSLHYQGLPL